MIDPTALAICQTEIARLELISHGTVTAWRINDHPEQRKPGGTGDLRRAKAAKFADGGNRPSGESRPPHDAYRERLERAESSEEVLRIAVDARRARRAVQHSPRVEVVPETPEEREERIMRPVYTDISPAEVALRENVTVREVIRAREVRDLDPGSGRAWPVEEDRTARVVRLRGQGLTVRAISSSTGVPRETVRRIVKKAA